MDLILEFEQETDGRWIAEIPELPGVLAYGMTRMQAGEKATALALASVPMLDRWKIRELSP